MLVKQPKNSKWSIPHKPVFYIMCSMRASQITLRHVTDRQTVCRNTSNFKLANAVINTTDEPDMNKEAQPLQIVSDLEILEKGTLPIVITYQTTVVSETLEEPPNAEIPPEPKAEPALGAERDQPVNQPAVTRPKRERRQSSCLKDYVLA